MTVYSFHVIGDSGGKPESDADRIVREYGGLIVLAIVGVIVVAAALLYRRGKR